MTVHDPLRAELETKTLDQLRVLARHLKVPYSGKRRAALIDQLLETEAKRDRLKLALGPLHLRRKPNELIIMPPEPSRLKRLAGVFVAVFGTFWLLLEPLSSFTAGRSVLSSIGWWGYLVLAGMSFLITIAFESYRHRKVLESHDFVSFFLIFPKTGPRVLIKAPSDMEVESFLRALATRVGVSRLLPVESTILHLRRHNLMIKTEEGFRPVDSRLTLREAGVLDGTVCRLRDYVRVEYTVPQLDIEYSWQPVRLELARAGGLVLLDEKDSIDYGKAKALGLLTPTAIARIDRFLQQSPRARVFVSVCPAEEINDVPDLATREELP